MAPDILNTVTRRRCAESFMPRLLNPRRKVPDAHWIGGLVGLRADLDAVTKRKEIPTIPGIEIRSSSPEPSHYTG